MPTVADAMTPTVIVDRSTTVQEASARMLDARSEVAVVVDGGTVSGLLLPSHVAQAMAAGLTVGRTPVETVCDQNPPLAQPHERLIDVHDRLHKQHRLMAVAVDAHHRPVGVVSFSS